MFNMFSERHAYKRILDHDELEENISVNPHARHAAPNAHNHSKEENVRFRGDKRLIERGGDFHQSTGKIALRKKIKRKYFRALYGMDLFHSLVDAPTTRIIGILMGTYMLIVIFFALIYWTISRTLGCNLDIVSFSDSFAFSLETMATIGYSTSDIFFDDCPLVLTSLAIQVCVKLIADAVTIGVLYCKLSRPHARASTVIFSDKAVIRRIRGKLYFMFQLCELRKHQLVEAHVRVYVVRNEIDLSACFESDLPNEQEQEHMSDDADELNSYHDHPHHTGINVNNSTSTYNPNNRDHTRSNPHGNKKHTPLTERHHHSYSMSSDEGSMEAFSSNPSGGYNVHKYHTLPSHPAHYTHSSDSYHSHHSHSHPNVSTNAPPNSTLLTQYTIRSTNRPNYMQTSYMRLNHPNDELGGMLLLMTPQVVVHEIDAASPLMPPPVWYCNFAYDVTGNEDTNHHLNSLSGMGITGAQLGSHQSGDCIRWRPPAYRHFIQYMPSTKNSTNNNNYTNNNTNSNTNNNNNRNNNHNNNNNTESATSTTTNSKPTPTIPLTTTTTNPAANMPGPPPTSVQFTLPTTLTADIKPPPTNTSPNVTTGVKSIPPRSMHRYNTDAAPTVGTNNNSRNTIGAGNNNNNINNIADSNNTHPFADNNTDYDNFTPSQPMWFYDAEALSRIEFPSVSRRIDTDSITTDLTASSNVNNGTSRESAMYSGYDDYGNNGAYDGGNSGDGDYETGNMDNDNTGVDGSTENESMYTTLHPVGGDSEHHRGGVTSEHNSDKHTPSRSVSVKFSDDPNISSAYNDYSMSGIASEHTSPYPGQFNNNTPTHAHQSNHPHHHHTYSTHSNNTHANDEYAHRAARFRSSGLSSYADLLNTMSPSPVHNINSSYRMSQHDLSPLRSPHYMSHSGNGPHSGGGYGGMHSGLSSRGSSTSSNLNTMGGPSVPILQAVPSKRISMSNSAGAEGKAAGANLANAASTSTTADSVGAGALANADSGLSSNTLLTNSNTTSNSQHQHLHQHVAPPPAITPPTNTAINPTTAITLTTSSSTTPTPALTPKRSPEPARTRNVRDAATLTTLADSSATSTATTTTAAATANTAPSRNAVIARNKLKFDASIVDDYSSVVTAPAALTRHRSMSLNSPQKVPFDTTTTTATPTSVGGDRNQYSSNSGGNSGRSASSGSVDGGANSGSGRGRGMTRSRSQRSMSLSPDKASKRLTIEGIMRRGSANSSTNSLSRTRSDLSFTQNTSTSGGSGIGNGSPEKDKPRPAFKLGNRHTNTMHAITPHPPFPPLVNRSSQPEQKSPPKMQVSPPPDRVEIARIRSQRDMYVSPYSQQRLSGSGSVSGSTSVFGTPTTPGTDSRKMFNSSVGEGLNNSSSRGVSESGEISLFSVDHISSGSISNQDSSSNREGYSGGSSSGGTNSHKGMRRIDSTFDYDEDVHVVEDEMMLFDDDFGHPGNILSDVVNTVVEALPSLSAAVDTAITTTSTTQTLPSSTEVVPDSTRTVSNAVEVAPTKPALDLSQLPPLSPPPRTLPRTLPQTLPPILSDTSDWENEEVQEPVFDAVGVAGSSKIRSFSRNNNINNSTNNVNYSSVNLATTAPSLPYPSYTNTNSKTGTTAAANPTTNIPTTVKESYTARVFNNNPFSEGDIDLNRNTPTTTTTTNHNHTINNKNNKHNKTHTTSNPYNDSNDDDAGIAMRERANNCNNNPNDTPYSSQPSTTNFSPDSGAWSSYTATPITWQDEERSMVQRYLRDRQVEIIVIVEGVDAATGGMVQARHSYTAGEIEWDKSFACCVLKDPVDGCTTIDFSRFHELLDVPADAPFAGVVHSAI